VDYWGANRNVRGHLSCATKAVDYGGENNLARTLFNAGCVDAKERLEAIDEARHADAQYRAGFNDEAGRAPINP
jgi:hypothetical protein